MHRIDSLSRTLVLTIVGLLSLGVSPLQVSVPNTLTDSEFWGLVTTLSESSGRFPPQYMSNEDSAQHVMPELIARTEPGGVYIGVGSEQNFNYIAGVEPGLAFIVDIRRDNMLQMLLYKALFELSEDRIAFVSKLFSRPAPSGLAADATVGAIFDAVRETTADEAAFARTLDEVIERLTTIRGFALDREDRDGIGRMLGVFRDAGPDLLEGFGDMANPTYAEMMALTDRDGRTYGYLTTPGRYRRVRDLHERNLVVPIVGDFAGDRALAGIGRFLAEHGLGLDTFYVSNVERYLWEQGEIGMEFYRNVEAIPRNPGSIFIRSVTADISRRLGIPIPDGTENWRTFLFEIDRDLEGVREGKIAGYRDLFLSR